MKTKDEIMDDLLLQLPETYNNAIEVIAEKTLEIEELKYQLNNSQMFHCPHFLTNDSGGISCHKDFENQIQEVLTYCEPHQKFMWAKYITGILKNKKDWKDL
jgi:hypothetical protein